MARATATTRAAAEVNPDAVLTEALINATKNLDLTQAVLARVTGLSPSTISRMPGRTIDANSKPGELALLLLRAYRSLYALLGGNLDQCRLWFHSENKHLGGRPIELVQTTQGLIRVADYLDAMRGHS